MESGESICTEHLEQLIKKYMPFIIRTVSNITGKYVSVEHDDEFSIALSAFAEAVERYQEEKGKFLPFAGMVIRSRLLSYLEKENRRREDSLDEMMENGKDFLEKDLHQEELHEEIIEFQSELQKFSLSLEILAENSPKHKDTRKTAVNIAEHSSRDDEVINQTYRKLKLPIRMVSRLCEVSERIVKANKFFILATMLVFIKKLPCLCDWIKGTRCDYVR